MKRFGILTRHSYPNYGSILQAYALQHALLSAGVRTEVIDYRPSGDRPWGLVSASLSLSRMRNRWWQRTIYRMVQTPSLILMTVVFRRYQKRLLALSPEVSNGSELRLLSRSLDAVVVGSDQVWNRVFGALERAYFLVDLDSSVERRSYAASLGSERAEPTDIPEITNALRKMMSVSVREANSAEWLVSQGIHARSDVDPVLLHGAEFWGNFAGSGGSVKPYALVYQLHNTPEFTSAVRALQRKHNVRIVRVTPDLKRVILPGRTRLLVSPQTFVRLFRDAAYVLTDSFHGTAFSLRLGRPLYVVPPKLYASRISDLLAKAQVSDLIVSATEVGLVSVNPNYDAELVTRLLDFEAAKSWSYLWDVTR